MKPNGTKRIRNSDTAHRLAGRIESLLRDAAAEHEAYKLPMDDLAERFIGIMLPARRLPLYYQGRLDGVRESLRLAIIRQHAEWRVWWRGKEYSSSPGSAAGSTSEIEAGTWNEVRPSRFVWRGTNRDFYRQG